MSKNLGNIPAQDKMSEEQEQTFTNGINKGRKLENERIIALLESEAVKTNWIAKWDNSLGVYGNVANYLLSVVKESSK
jgi:hypothetical protein